MGKGLLENPSSEEKVVYKHFSWVLWGTAPMLGVLASPIRPSWVAEEL